MNRFTAFVFCVLLSVTTVAVAQLSPETSPKANAQSDAVPKHCYALNYVLKELEGSKVINSRSYVLNTIVADTHGGDWTRLRVGNRVPVFVHSQEKGSTNTVTDFNYIDVGVNIDNRLREAGDALALEVTADIRRLLKCRAA